MKSIVEMLKDVRELGDDPRLTVWERNFSRDVNRMTDNGRLHCHLTGNQIFHIEKLHRKLFGDESHVVKTWGGGGKKTRGSLASPSNAAPSRETIKSVKFWSDDPHACPSCHNQEDRRALCQACEGTGTAFTKEVEA